MQSGLNKEAALRKVASTQILPCRKNRSEWRGVRTEPQDTSPRRGYKRPAGGGEPQAWIESSERRLGPERATQEEATEQKC